MMDKSSKIKIIYGVSGEGSGHAIRSREVIRHLVKHGHEVQVVTYGRGKDLLGSEFPVTEVFGLHFNYQHNAVRYLPTIWRNLISAPKAVDSLKLMADLFQSFCPAVVCTDFEPLTSLTAMRFGVPVVAIGNIHHVLFRRAKVPWRYRHDWLVARAVIRLIVPRADHYVVTTLADEPVKKSYVHIVPPIVRPSILSAKPSVGGCILVYDSFKNEKLPAILRKTKQSYHIYGHGQGGPDGNLDFRAFGEQEFLDDLLNCRAIIGTGGFTLISESLVLKKPYLAIPIAGQFEQIDNALELERLGYGKMLRLAQANGVAEFLNNLDVFEERLETYRHPGNDRAMALIESLVNELANVKVIH
ncbi:hypothetical protein A3I40_02085 [Candidatus Uhrbacteria bacterium RIFCSPLOWO2_02_FULL_48_12]|uniref:Glycosyl transferase family 28 C-terminal domain-containing protein n=1 Tax=Candidatus Uhrbacteria bacterium RIFCSPLOWO2_02_FULL_48_12 TaxID=1802407 RepID=A0A1F7VBK3_9BACT|nr:MAG: hypothetical protein A3I40_02085 [Candidatus Uhrbacteria bacterium RIFCSPLOWO2_02_FULL_48_12]